MNIVWAAPSGTQTSHRQIQMLYGKFDFPSAWQEMQARHTQAMQ